MFDHLGLGSGAARNLSVRGYYILSRRATNDINLNSAVDLPQSTLAALIVAVIAILVVLGFSLWVVLRYTCTRDGRKEGMKVGDDRDAYQKEKGIKEQDGSQVELDGVNEVPNVEVTSHPEHKTD
ncbi:Hypothetical protein D9617_13g098840 [Elsinoe fawcettii]|nr:Hypothetical protein D9617_13g098840 [Elsinoe fawcettii]